MIRAHFREFANYNRWANERLYAAVRKLSTEDYLQERQAFFKSIHRTLNHILLTDRIWLDRLAERPPRFTTLDQELYKSLKELERGRRTTDEEIIDWIEELSDADLDRSISYLTTSQPQARYETPIAKVLTHLFNHQTHHRGQVHDQLSQTTIAPPPLDMILFFRQRQME